MSLKTLFHLKMNMLEMLFKNHFDIKSKLNQKNETFMQHKSSVYQVIKLV
jgi:hypothetical protein